MNSQPAFADELTRDLRAHQALCEETLALLLEEQQSLAKTEHSSAFEIGRKRKGLLHSIAASFNNIRRWRQLWQQASPQERADVPEVKQVFHAIQSCMMRILLLDRENRQALLQRGLVPAQHLPPAASQQSHFVAGLYRRHCAS